MENSRLVIINELKNKKKQHIMENKQLIANKSKENGVKYLKTTAKHLFTKEDGSYMYVKEQDDKFYLVTSNKTDELKFITWESVYQFSGGLKQWLKHSKLFYLNHGYISTRWRKRRDIDRNITI